MSIFHGIFWLDAQQGVDRKGLEELLGKGVVQRSGVCIMERVLTEEVSRLVYVFKSLVVQWDKAVDGWRETQVLILLSRISQIASTWWWNQ